MYKVFIQDRPIFFISADEISNYTGILIPLPAAENHNAYIVNLVSQLPEELPVYISCPDPEAGVKAFFEGYDMVEAAGGIVKRKDKYLFIKRNGLWDLPKGKMEDGETPEVSAKREIEEECGILDPEVRDLIMITYHTYLYKGTPTIKKTYWYELAYAGSKEVKPQLEEGITKVSWKAKDKLQKVRAGTYASINEVIDRYFGEGGK